MMQTFCRWKRSQVRTSDVILTAVGDTVPRVTEVVNLFTDFIINNQFCTKFDFEN